MLPVSNASNVSTQSISSLNVSSAVVFPYDQYSGVGNHRNIGYFVDGINKCNLSGYLARKIEYASQTISTESLNGPVDISEDLYRYGVISENLHEQCSKEIYNTVKEDFFQELRNKLGANPKIDEFKSITDHNNN